MVNKGAKKETEERRRAQEILRQYERIVSTTPDPIAILDRNYRFQMVNDACLTGFGKSRDQILGKTASEVLGSKVFERSIKKHLDRCLKGEVITYQRWFDFMTIGRRFMSVNYYPYLDADDGVSGVVMSARDITERRHAEVRLQENEKRFRNLFEQSNDAIFLHKSNRIIDVNQRACEMLGYNRNQLLSMSIPDLHHKKDRTESERRINTAYRGESILFETQFVKVDGTTVDVEVSSKIIDHKNKIIQGIARDITERTLAQKEKKGLEAQLQHAQKMEALGTLAGGIAHNFNNLLMGIQGNVSLMLLETDPAHPNYNRLKRIEQSVQSGSNLTSQLLSYAREERYEIKPLNVNRLLEETSETFATAKREIRVHRELCKGIQGILADQGQIEQVLLNLYINAEDAMPGGGDLFLKTANVAHKDMGSRPYKVKHGDYIIITVRDTGIGMDEETMEHIFEPFFTTKGLAKGTGLGLASVYGIIKAHAGYIEVDSHKGQGTIFSIYLPASKKKLPEARVHSVGITTGTETVLLVDDEEMILEVGTQMLEALGYKVVEARSGREAIDIVSKAHRAKRKAEEGKERYAPSAMPPAPDLIILDMIMPDMGGRETLERIRELNSDIKVLLSSGYSIDGWAKEILERGCDGFIQKPFDIKELSQKVREILDTH